MWNIIDRETGEILEQIENYQEALFTCREYKRLDETRKFAVRREKEYSQ